MGPKLKCDKNGKVTKKWNVTMTEMSQKLKYHPYWYVTKTEISQTEMWPKLRYHLKLNVTETKMLLKLKCHKISGTSSSVYLPFWDQL